MDRARRSGSRAAEWIPPAAAPASVGPGASASAGAAAGASEALSASAHSVQLRVSVILLPDSPAFLLLHLLAQWTHALLLLHSSLFLSAWSQTLPVLGHLDCILTVTAPTALSRTLLKTSSVNNCILKDGGAGGQLESLEADLYTLLIYCSYDVIYLCGCAGLPWLGRAL